MRALEEAVSGRVKGLSEEKLGFLGRLSGGGAPEEGWALMPTLSKAHFSCVYSANLLMKESSFSGMITLLGWTGSVDVGDWPLLPSLTVTFSFSPLQVPPSPAPRPHLRVSTGRGSKLPSASTVAFFSALDE